MALIVIQLKVLKLEIVNGGNVFVDLERRKGVWGSFDLLFKRFNVIQIHVRITQRVDKLSRFQTTDLRCTVNKYAVKPMR